MTQIPLKERAEALQSYYLAEKVRMDELPIYQRKNPICVLNPDQIEVVNYYIEQEMMPELHFNHSKTKIQVMLYTPTFDKD